MAKGQRRTPEQMIADLQKKIDALKAKSSLKADHESIKPIIESIKAAAKSNGVEVKAIIKIISEKLAPRQPRGTIKVTKTKAQL